MGWYPCFFVSYKMTPRKGAEVTKNDAEDRVTIHPHNSTFPTHPMCRGGSYTSDVLEKIEKRKKVLKYAKIVK